MRIFARSGPSPFPEVVKDISIAGAHVLTRSPLPAGFESMFAVHLPHHDAPLELKGHVVWSTTAAMGVQFEKSEPRLSSFVDRLEADAVRI